MKAAKDIAWWIVWHGIFGLLIYWGAYEGQAGPGRALVFLAWLYAIVGPFSLSKTSIDLRRKKGTATVPRQITGLVQAAMVAALVWQGWWFTAIALMVTFVCVAVNYAEAFPKKKQAEMGAA